MSPRGPQEQMETTKEQHSDVLLDDRVIFSFFGAFSGLFFAQGQPNQLERKIHEQRSVATSSLLRNACVCVCLEMKSSPTEEIRNYVRRARLLMCCIFRCPPQHDMLWMDPLALQSDFLCWHYQETMMVSKRNTNHRRTDLIEPRRLNKWWYRSRDIM